MAEIKDTIQALIDELEDVITEVEDSDEIIDEDLRADTIDSLEEASTNLIDAMMNF